MIAETGLQHPIQVLKTGNSTRLVAGAHRLRAFPILGRADIPAMVYEPETDKPELELRLAEIVENVGRRELSAIDRAASIVELQRVYRDLHGERRGGDRKSGKSKAQSLHFWSIGDNIAAKMNLSKRTIFAAAEMYEGLSPASRARVAGSPYAENHVQLRDLSKLDASQQAKALDLMLGEAPKAKRVADALAIIEKRPKAKTDHDKT